MESVLVVGSLNMDVIIRVSELPRKGETRLVKYIDHACGGKGANQAVALGRLGVNVSMIGKVGNDDYGKKLIKNLEESNVGIQGISISNNERSGTAYITVDDNGENTISVNLGANSSLLVEDIEKNKNVILCSDFIVLQMEIPRNIISYVIKYSKEIGKKIILNLAPAVKIDKDTLEKVDFLILNKAELLSLLGSDLFIINNKNLFRLLKQARMKFRGNIILTLGEKGSVLFDEGDNLSEFNAFTIKSADGTAGGDAFVAGFVFGLCKKRSLSDSIIIANAAGALAVSKAGAQPSLPYKDELENFLSSEGFSFFS